MTVALKNRLRGPSKSYLALVSEFPLYPIRAEDEYDRAAAILNRLVMKDDEQLDEGERQYRDALELLIEEYDDDHFPAPQAGTVGERLRFLMEQNGLSVSELAAVIGVKQPMASLILRDKRKLQVEQIKRLSERFALEAGYFM